MKNILLALLCLFSLHQLSAQAAQQTIHQVFPLDSVETIRLDLYDPYQPQEWEGHQLMIRTTVKLYRANDGILKYFVDNNRYHLLDTVQTKQLMVWSEDKERRTIKSREGECYEQVEVVVYLPKNYEKQGEHQWRRKPEE